MLEPTTFPSARSGYPAKAERTLTISSGREVAKDTTVIPIINLGMANLFEVPTAARNNHSPPTMSPTSPAIIFTISIPMLRRYNTGVFVFLNMKKFFFKVLAKVNKAILPSLSKKGVDLAKASKFQLALVAWRSYVTMRSL
jgi:hypothetical protein